MMYGGKVCVYRQRIANKRLVRTLGTRRNFGISPAINVQWRFRLCTSGHGVPQCRTTEALGLLCSVKKAYNVI